MTRKFKYIKYQNIPKIYQKITEKIQRLKIYLDTKI